VSAAPLLVEGTQVPRVFWSPPVSAFTAADDALEFVGSCGIDLDPWQRLAVRTALAERSDGRWAAFEFALFVARQNGKGEVIMALELAKLFLLRFGRPPLILHSAHLFPTAQEAFRRIRDVVDGTDFLRREVRKINFGHGEEGIELRDGARLRFMARTVSGAGRGFSPTDLMLDEVFRLPVEAMAANLPALSAQRNPQICYFASAGYPDSEVQWRLVERGRSGNDPSLAYMEYSPAPGASLDDEQAWLDTNPAVGYRPGLTLETIGRERRTLTDEVFARERMSKWADNDLDRIISPTRWAELVAEGQTPVVVAVDGSLDGDVAVVGAGSGPVVWLLDHRLRTGGIVEFCRQLDKQHDPVFLLDEASPVFWLARELQDAGLTVHTLKPAEVASAAAQFVEAVTLGTVRHVPSPVFDDAVAGCRARPFRDGGFFFGRRASNVDISPVTAAAAALWGWFVYGEGLGVDDITVRF
jgi:hypothetical protein